MRGTALSLERFRSILDEIGRDHRFVDEDEASETLRRRSATDRTCWVTIDDGYRDTVDVVLPELTRRRITASLFITTGILSGSWRFPVDDWYATLRGATRRRPLLSELGCPARAVDLDNPMDFSTLVDGPEKRAYVNSAPETQRSRLAQLANLLQSRDVPAPALLTRGDLQVLADAGWRIGGHGRTHRVFGARDGDTEALRHEVLGSHADLAAFGATRSCWFAWPDGVVGAGAARWLAGEASRAGLVGALSLATDEYRNGFSVAREFMR